MKYLDTLAGIGPRGGHDSTAWELGPGDDVPYLTLRAAGLVRGRRMSGPTSHSSKVGLLRPCAAHRDASLIVEGRSERALEYPMTDAMPAP